MGMAVIMGVTIFVFNLLNNTSVIDAVYILASYTYGPILGLFAFGIFMKQQVHDKYIPAVAVASPFLCFILQKNSEAWFNGYQFSYELLIFNALFTFIGLCILIKKKQEKTFNLIRHHHECKTSLFIQYACRRPYPPYGRRARTLSRNPPRNRKISGCYRAKKEVSIGHITIDSVAIKGNALQLFANMNCSYIPFRENNVAEIYQGISALLPAELTKYRLQLHTNKHCIEELIPSGASFKKKIKSPGIQPRSEKAFGDQSIQTLYAH